MAQSDVKFVISAVNNASGVLKGVQSSINALKSTANGVRSTISGWMSPFRSVLGVIGNIARSLMTLNIVSIAGITAALGVMGNKAIDLASSFEQSKMALTSMIGSEKLAVDFLEKLQRFANVTPFQFTQLVPMSQRLMAYGFSFKEVIPTLTAVGDATSALGASSETLDRIVLAIGQIKAKGKISGEEMRQLAEAGIPAWDMLAKAIGKSIPETMRLSEKLTGIQAEIGLPALLQGMESRYGGMMDRASKLFKGLVSTVKDYFDYAMRSIGTPIIHKLEGVIGGIIAIVDQLISTGVFTRLGEKIADIFSRDNVLRVAVYFGNIIEWGKKSLGWLKDTMNAVGFFIGNIWDWLTSKLKFFFDMTVLVTKAIIAMKAAELGVQIALTGMKIAASIPNPYAAGAVASAALMGGAAIGGAYAGTGLGAVDYAVKSLNTGISKLGLNINPFPSFPTLEMAKSSNLNPLATTFMRGYDEALKAAQATQRNTAATAAGVGQLVAQNQMLIERVYGGGARTRSTASRFAFGGGIRPLITAKVIR